MLGRFFQQIFNSFGVVFRTFRAFFTRQFMGVRARISRITSFSRQAALLIPKAMSSLAIAGQKPSSRKDFIETKRLFVAKSLLVMLAAGIVVLGLFVYFIAWPWIVSRFFTAQLFYQDPKLSTYNGRVQVYYDEEKTALKLTGELTEGQLQGEGMEYDESGLLTYQGSFVNGQREGEGSLYENGVLCYQGEFSKGIPNGQGVSYYPSGGQEYVGTFHQGVYDGEGTLYYENGQTRYKGLFSAGNFEGQGRLYQEDGELLYEGSFQEGVYAGEGKLRVGEGLQLVGEFEGGTPLGEVSIYREGKLNYQGEVTDLVPDGQGTLYASDGTAIYTGSMSQGSPDFAALLELTGDDIRAAFAQAKLEETAGENGFSICNRALGVTLFCSYKTEESDPRVHDIYCYNTESDSFAQVMPWKNSKELESGMSESGEPEREQTESFSAVTPFEDGPYYAVVYSLPDYTIRGWSEAGQTAWFMVQWSAPWELPESGLGGEEEESSQQPEETNRLDSLLRSLGVGEAEEATSQTNSAADAESQVLPVEQQVSGDEVSQSQNSSSQSSSTSTTSEKKTPTIRLARDTTTTEDIPSEEALDPAVLAEGLSSVTDYYLQAETLAELEQQISLKGQLLELLQEQDRMGKGDPDLLEELETQVPDLEIRAGQAQVQLERLQMEDPGLADRDYSQTLVALLHPPTEFAANALQAAGGGREEELSLAELELSWQAAQQAKTAYEKAADAATQAEEAYRTGAADEIAVNQAKCAQSEAAVQLHEAVHAYAQGILTFNTVADGYLSAQYGWEQLLEQ